MEVYDLLTLSLGIYSMSMKALKSVVINGNLHFNLFVLSVGYHDEFEMGLR